METDLEMPPSSKKLKFVATGAVTDGLVQQSGHQVSPPASKNEEGRKVLFRAPVDLYDLLMSEDPAIKQVVSWAYETPNESRFVIHSHSSLCNHTTPSFFQSFARYGFVRDEGAGRDTYYHSDGLFLHGRPELLQNIHQKKPLMTQKEQVLHEKKNLQ